MSLTIGVDKLKKEMIIRIKRYLLQWNSNNVLGNAVKITDLEFAPGKLGIPADAIKQLLNRLHKVQDKNRWQLPT